MQGGFNPWVRKIPWRRKWQPTAFTCLVNPMDRGTWQATVHGVPRVGHNLAKQNDVNSIAYWICSLLV